MSDVLNWKTVLPGNRNHLRSLLFVLLILLFATACKPRKAMPVPIAQVSNFSSPTPPPIPTLGDLTPTPTGMLLEFGGAAPLEPEDVPAGGLSPSATPTFTPTFTPLPGETVVAAAQSASGNSSSNPGGSASETIPTATQNTASTGNQAGSAPTKTPMPTATSVPPTSAPPASAPLITNSQGVPYRAQITGLTGNARTIYQRGLQLGRDPHKFMRVGDCEAESPFYLVGFDQGDYNLARYSYLQDVLNHFAGSFEHRSPAGRGGFVAASVLNPMWADQLYCQPGETPLDCEFRLNPGSIALVQLRTTTSTAEGYAAYEQHLSTVVEYLIDKGIVPVLGTNPDLVNGDSVQVNNRMRAVASRYGIPMWDLWASLQTLPQHGVDPDYHLSFPPDFKATHLTDQNLQYGMTLHNLETLEVLHAMMTRVMS